MLEVIFEKTICLPKQGWKDVYGYTTALSLELSKIDDPLTIIDIPRHAFGQRETHHPFATPGSELIRPIPFCRTHPSG
jgi:hypothetical protein